MILKWSFQRESRKSLNRAFNYIVKAVRAQMVAKAAVAADVIKAGAT
jgi:hypothetical protein